MPVYLTNEQKLDALSAVVMALKAKHRDSPLAASLRKLAKDYGGGKVAASAIEQVLSSTITELFPAQAKATGCA